MNCNATGMPGRLRGLLGKHEMSATFLPVSAHVAKQEAFLPLLPSNSASR